MIRNGTVFFGKEMIMPHRDTKPDAQTSQDSSGSSQSITQDNPQRNRHLGIIITILMAAMLMSSLNQMIFSTALPTIVGELNGVSHMSWVITAFLLGQSISMPIFGKLGDLYGRKDFFLGAIGLFILGSVIGGFAPSMGLLILARAIQGVAAGAMMILSQAITADVTTARERGKYMGFMGSVFGISSVLGPLLGGWFTDGPGWRWAIWLNIPLGLLIIVFGSFVLKLPRHRNTSSVDYLGTLFMAIATSSTILIATWGGHQYAWTSPVILGLIAVVIIATIIFIWVERRADNPIIPLLLFTNRNFILTTVAGITVGLFMFGSLSYLPTYLQMVHEMSPTMAGLQMIPMTIGLVGSTTIVGILITRTGKYKYYPIVGMMIIIAAMITLSTLTPDKSLWFFGISLLILGTGVGSAMQVLVLIAQNSFPMRMVGTATGANNFFRQVGGSLGSALIGGLFTGRLAEQMTSKFQEFGVDPHTVASQGFNANSITPGAFKELSAPIQHAVQWAYNDALTPIFLYLSPLAVFALILLFFIREERLAETFEEAEAK